MKNNINYQKIQDVWASFGVLQVHFLSYIHHYSNSKLYTNY